jgi:hypothetical protein
MLGLTVGDCRGGEKWKKCGYMVLNICGLLVLRIKLIYAVSAFWLPFGMDPLIGFCEQVNKGNLQKPDNHTIMLNIAFIVTLCRSIANPRKWIKMHSLWFPGGSWMHLPID